MILTRDNSNKYHKYFYKFKNVSRTCGNTTLLGNCRKVKLGESCSSQSYIREHLLILDASGTILFVI